MQRARERGGGRESLKTDPCGGGDGKGGWRTLASLIGFFHPKTFAEERDIRASSHCHHLPFSPDVDAHCEI